MTSLLKALLPDLPARALLAHATRWAAGQVAEIAL
jgi:hypothetical protein